MTSHRKRKSPNIISEMCLFGWKMINDLFLHINMSHTSFNFNLQKSLSSKKWCRTLGLSQLLHFSIVGQKKTELICLLTYKTKSDHASQRESLAQHHITRKKIYSNKAAETGGGRQLNSVALSWSRSFLFKKKKVCKFLFSLSLSRSTL